MHNLTFAIARAIVASVVTLALAPVVAGAGVPQLLNQQGVLTDASGVVVPDDEYLLEFELFDSPGGGTELFSQQLTVNVVGGLYNVLLSDSGGNQLSDVFANPLVYLQVRIVSNQGGTYSDVTLLPRQQIASVPYALKAGNIDEIPAPESDPLLGLGRCNARIEWVSDEELKLVPIGSSTLVIEAGGVLLSQAGPLSVTWAALSGAPQSGRFYYIYVEDDGSGAPSPVISTSPPVDWALPTDPSKRYVGDLYSDSTGADIAKVDHNPLTGEYRFLEPQWDWIPIFEGGRSANTSFDLFPLTGYVPVTASAVLIHAFAHAKNFELRIGHSAVKGHWLKDDEPEPGAWMRVLNGGGNKVSANVPAWIPIDGSDPEVTWATADAGSNSHAAEALRIAVFGWRSLR